ARGGGYRSRSDPGAELSIHPHVMALSAAGHPGRASPERHGPRSECARAPRAARTDAVSAHEGTEMTDTSLDTLCVNTIRTLAMDAVQQANSGHPGTPMAMAPVAYALWQQRLR